MQKKLEEDIQDSCRFLRGYAIRWTIIFFLIVLLLSGCISESDTWQTVDIGDCGSMKIPQNWQCIMEHDIIYILDENFEPIMEVSK